tara:strand:+ start:2916 stop:3104 length:189 start_codon:yes stop_codon:yes gene_type:complete
MSKELDLMKFSRDCIALQEHMEALFFGFTATMDLFRKLIKEAETMTNEQVIILAAKGGDNVQ